MGKGMEQVLAAEDYGRGRMRHMVWASVLWCDRMVSGLVEVAMGMASMAGRVSDCLLEEEHGRQKQRRRIQANDISSELLLSHAIPLPHTSISAYQLA